MKQNKRREKHNMCGVAEWEYVVACMATMLMLLTVAVEALIDQRW